MADPPGSADGRTPAGLGYVCAHLSEIEMMLSTYGSRGPGPLERLVAAIPAGTDLDVLLDELDAAIREAGDVLGVHDNADRGITAVGVEAMEIVYRCPLQRCTGRSRGEVGRLAPTCDISGRELLRERLE